MPTRSWCLVALLLATACARRASVPVAAPAAPEMTAAAGLHVLLTWSAPVDLDLYLTDPTSETVYFANNPSHSGARLVRDTRCGDVQAEDGAFMELAYVPEPRAGRYRAGVDFIERCSAAAQPVSYRVVAELGGARRETTGVIELEKFQPIALEFDIRRDGPVGPLALGSASLSEEEPP